jgi:hypothetical protein
VNEWVQQTNIRGPQGLKGDTGDQGPQGIQGPQGPAGGGATISATQPVGALEGALWFRTTDKTLLVLALGVWEPVVGTWA